MNDRKRAAVAVAALMALVLTGCGETPDECEDDVTSQSLVTGRGGTSGGGGSRSGGGFKPSAPKGPNLTKQRPAQSGAGSSSGGSGSKHKAPKVHIDSEDCD